MHSLTELRDFFKSFDIQIKHFNGATLTIGKDVWTLYNDVYYLNGEAQNIKDKKFMQKYKASKEKKVIPKRKKIMSARFYDELVDF
jgi:hypothetical protein